MPIPVLSIILLIFVLWLWYEIRKTNKRAKEDTEAFWKNENSSNSARRKDISNLDYFTITFDRLPMEDHADETINSYRDTLRKLSEKKLLNLTGITNTELKYQYGAANIKLLSEYDNNYIIFVSILQKWADRLYTRGSVEDAKKVLEYAISCHTDVSKSYRLLANIYKEQNTLDKISHLIEIIPDTKMISKELLIEELTILKSI